jgi:hypothetical protein
VVSNTTTYGPVRLVPSSGLTFRAVPNRRLCFPDRLSLAAGFAPGDDIKHYVSYAN